MNDIIHTSILMRYKKIGDDITIYDYNRVSNKITETKICDLSDNDIKMLLKKSENSVSVYTKAYVSIYNDVLHKRRFVKIKQIKDKITHDRISTFKKI